MSVPILAVARDMPQAIDMGSKIIEAQYTEKAKNKP